MSAGRQRKTRSSLLGTNALWSVVPPRLGQPVITCGLTKNPAGVATGKWASLTRSRIRRLEPLISFALITVAAPARTTHLNFRPATPRSIRFWRTCETFTNPSLSVPPFQNVLVLFNVFRLSTCQAGLYRVRAVMSRALFFQDIEGMRIFILLVSRVP